MKKSVSQLSWIFKKMDIIFVSTQIYTVTVDGPVTMPKADMGYFTGGMVSVQICEEFGVWIPQGPSGARHTAALTFQWLNHRHKNIHNRDQDYFIWSFQIESVHSPISTRDAEYLHTI